MVRKYEIKVAIAPNEVMALRATVEPILINEMSAEIKSVTVTAGRGMFHLGEILESPGEPGSPPSRANAQTWRNAAATSETAHAAIMTRLDLIPSYVNVLYRVYISNTAGLAASVFDRFYSTL